MVVCRCKDCRYSDAEHIIVKKYCYATQNMAYKHRDFKPYWCHKIGILVIDEWWCNTYRSKG